VEGRRGFSLGGGTPSEGDLAGIDLRERACPGTSWIRGIGLLTLFLMRVFQTTETQYEASKLLS
jgi:hypothetical protein